MTEEKIQPIKLYVKRLDETFELDFSKESVVFASNNQFDLDDVLKYPATHVPRLFYYAFRMHHKKLSKQQTDRILEEDMHGMTPKILERLMLLYNQAVTSNNVQDEEDLEKNGEVTVEM